MEKKFDLGDLSDVPDPFSSVSGATAAFRRSGAFGASPSRSGRARLRVLAVVAAAVYEALAIALYKLRPDLARTAGFPLAVELAIPLAAAGGVFVLAARKGALGLGETLTRLAAGILGAPLFFAAATLLTAPSGVPDPQFRERAWACIVTSAALGVGPLVVALWATRHAFVAAAAWRAAALGIACGAVASTAIGLVCPVTAALHLLVGHGAVMLILGVAGALAGRRITRA